MSSILIHQQHSTLHFFMLQPRCSLPFVELTCPDRSDIATCSVKPKRKSRFSTEDHERVVYKTSESWIPPSDRGTDRGTDLATGLAWLFGTESMRVLGFEWSSFGHMTPDRDHESERNRSYAHSDDTTATKICHKIIRAWLSASGWTLLYRYLDSAASRILYSSLVAVFLDTIL